MSVHHLFKLIGYIVLFNLLKVATWDMKRRKWDFFRLALILSLGFSALYTTLSLKGQLIARLEDQAKFLLTSDLAISVRRAISDQELAAFQKIIDKYPHDMTREITLLTIAAVKDSSNPSLPTAVNVKWVGENYPFYSKSKFVSKTETREAWNSLHNKDVVFLNKDQAERLGLKINDQIQILGKFFTITDLIEDDATIGSRFFSLFPIVFISLKNVPNQNIFGPQTSFFESRHVKWQKQLSLQQQQQIKTEIEKQLTDPALQVSLPKDSSEQNQRLWDTISDFLGILTLCSLILSILGLFTLMRYQWGHEIVTHRKLFLLGLKNSERFGIKLIQTNILAFLSLILCLATSFPMSKGLAFYLPSEMQVSMQFFHLTSFLFLSFCLWFILNSVSCYFFFLEKMSTSQDSNSKLNKGKTFFYGLIFFLFSLVIGRYLTRSWIITVIVIVSLMFLYLLLVGIINLVVKMATPYFQLPRKIPLRPNWQITLRLIFRSWQKNIGLYSMTVSCLGVVYFLLILLMALQVSMKTQLTFTSDKPDLFLFDVQTEDIDQISSALADYSGKSLALSPMIRGRLMEINNNPVVREDDKKNLTREEEEQSRFKFRAVSVSYKKILSSFEKILDGTELPPSWKVNEQKLIPISLESRYAKRLHVGVGDSLTFEFQGQIYKTIVQNLRYVFWLSMHPNFFIIFPDGVLNDLPQTYLSVLKFKDDSLMKDFTHYMQKDFNHISILLLKQTAALVMKQVDLLINAFFLVSSLFLILGVFLWLSVVFERLNMERGTTLLFTKLGINQNSISWIFLGEFMGMLLIIFLITPFLSFLAAYLIAAEYFDGLLVWPTQGILLLTIILVLPLAFITKYLVARFSMTNS